MVAGFGHLTHLWEMSKMVIAKFYDYTSPNVWPLNSPDLNPMDYYVCGTVEKDTNHRTSTTKTQLIDRIKVDFETLPRKTVTSAFSRFWNRIEAVIDDTGDYFKWNLLTVV